MRFSFRTIIAAALLSAPSAIQAEEKQKSSTVDTDMIVGGVDALENEWPWQVRLFDYETRERGSCGGSLISRQWVLTAAHCMFDSKGKFIDRVEVGHGNNHLQKLTRVKSSKVIVHSKYDPDNYSQNDIALIKLAKPVKFGNGTSSINQATTKFFDTLAGKKAWVTGWGALIDTKAFRLEYPDKEIPIEIRTPLELQKVDVVVQEKSVCEKSFVDMAQPGGQFCAGYDVGGKDACYGDSGGPIVAASADDATNWALIGVVSWGYGCAQPKEYGFYTRVDYYADWIKQTAAKN